MESCSEKEVISALHENENILETLKQYNNSHKQIFKLDPDTTTDRQKMIELLIPEIYKNENLDFLNEAFEIVRYLSRDKNVVDKYFATRKFVDCLLKQACSYNKGDNAEDKLQYSSIEVNSCKAICNVIYLTMDAQGVCCHGDFLKKIVTNIKQHLNRTHEQNVTSLRAIFLVSALNKQGRNILVNEHEARSVVIQFLQHIVDQNIDSDDKSVLIKLPTESCNMLCEILKVVFNLNMDLRKVKIYNQQETENMNSTVQICSIILNSQPEDPTLTEALHCNTGNALYSVPPHCFNVELFTPIQPGSSDNGEVRKNMKPVQSLLQILKNRIMNDKVTTDILQPLLALMSQLSRISRDIRKYYKKEVIPPRKDFKHRPEDGKEFRNKLIKLFTHNDTDVKSAAADFIFVLCKENVDRFVKYTGYGNAAGLLAARGLLAGGNDYEANYSEDSDSDTEEYKEASERINPVTGHVPPVVKNPMEGMSDEQKEFLAVQLANQISKLSSHDVMQPMCVGEDGKLVSLHQKFHEAQDIESEHSSDSD